MLTQLPITSMSWLPVLHDTLSHEADIRGAIGAPQLPGDVLAAAYPLLLTSLPAGCPASATSGWSWTSSRWTSAPVSRTWWCWPAGSSSGAAPSAGAARPSCAAGYGTATPRAFAVMLPVFRPRDTDLIESG